MGHKLGDKVGTSIRQRGRHRENTLKDKVPRFQMGDTMQHTVGDKLGDKRETRWQTKRQKRFQGFKVPGGRHSGKQAEKQSGRHWETRFQGSQNPAHTCQREERDATLCF